ncbi:MAG: gamma-glutamyl-gamma-aminobutyrate hydrolase [Halobacteriovoraceae bacterium]|nr:gamma-glutamyl-gamma-aminobutyrate hydrolase [Halobacteriovoraceae bacterium]
MDCHLKYPHHGIRMKPLIGVTKPLRGGLIQNLCIRLAIFMTGGRSINLTSDKPRLDLNLDGLIISGGTDIHPEVYSGSEFKHNYSYDRERDEMELNWLKKAEFEQIPTLCICRGAQLLNVYYGGSLFFDISKAYKNADYPNSLFAKIFFRKPARVLSGKIRDMIQQNKLSVNSLHTQAIATLGGKLKRTMIEDNGVVQAIEHKDLPFLLGVQFHPEFLIHRKEIRRIFKTLVSFKTKTV